MTIHAPFEPATLLLTEEQAAARLLMAPRTLREYRRMGQIRYVAITARKIGYRPEDCDEYVAARVRVEVPPVKADPTPKRKAGRGAPSAQIIPFSQRKGARL